MPDAPKHKILYEMCVSMLYLGTRVRYTTEGKRKTQQNLLESVSVNGICENFQSGTCYISVLWP